MKKIYKEFVNDYIGLASETKPTDAADGETFYEVDTKNAFIFYAGQWWPS